MRMLKARKRMALTAIAEALPRTLGRGSGERVDPAMLHRCLDYLCDKEYIAKQEKSEMWVYLP